MKLLLFPTIVSGGRPSPLNPPRTFFKNEFVIFCAGSYAQHSYAGTWCSQQTESTSGLSTLPPPRRCKPRGNTVRDPSNAEIVFKIMPKLTTSGFHGDKPLPLSGRHELSKSPKIVLRVTQHQIWCTFIVIIPFKPIVNVTQSFKQ